MGTSFCPFVQIWSTLTLQGVLFPSMLNVCLIRLGLSFGTVCRRRIFLIFSRFSVAAFSWLFSFGLFYRIPVDCQGSAPANHINEAITAIADDFHTTVEQVNQWSSYQGGGTKRFSVEIACTNTEANDVRNRNWQNVASIRNAVYALGEIARRF